MTLFAADGQGATANDERERLEAAAGRGDIRALNAYGTLILEEAERNPLLSTNELARIRDRSYRCFKWASDQGDSTGFYNLGICLMNGYGCKRDPKMAFDCFRAAAEGGNPEAINCLGGCFRDGVVVRRNLQLAALWFRKSAELGNEYGMFNYANALLSGEGVERQPEEAVKLLEKLVKTRGNPEGMNLLGVCRLRGIGCEKDESAAFGWFKKGAGKGLAMAMNNLANCYEQGTGTEKDDSQALVWRMRARAASGDRAAAEWLKENGK